MNITNPYTHRRRPRHRAWRRVLLLLWLCLLAVGVTLVLVAPSESTPPANREGGPVSLPMEPLSASAGAQSDHDFYAWYTADERNAVWYHIRDEFGMGHLGDQAVRVAQCESELNPRARSRTNDHGVFQINAVHRRTFERVTSHAWSPNVYHASLNARYARDLYDRQGWRPWVCRHAAG